MVIAYLENIFVLQIHQSRMNGGIPFQTSLRKDSGQASSKILSVLLYPAFFNKIPNMHFGNCWKTESNPDTHHGSSCRGQPLRNGSRGQCRGGPEARQTAHGAGSRFSALAVKQDTKFHMAKHQTSLMLIFTWLKKIMQIPNESKEKPMLPSTQLSQAI